MPLKLWIYGILLLPITACSTSQQRRETPAVSIKEKQEAKPAVEFSSAAEKSGLDKLAGISCRNGSDERNLAVFSKIPGCLVRYTKLGKTTDIASSMLQVRHCENVFFKIRKNLEAAGFTCD